MTRRIEVELKLQIAPEAADTVARVPTLAAGEPTQRKQTSVYFDTPDQAVAGAGYSLRVRHADGARTQTIKAEAAGAGLFQRGEWEREIGTDQPEPAGTPLAERLSSDDWAGLRPVFTIAVTRRIWDIRHGDSRIELVLDQGQISADGRTAPLSEIELELKAGPPAALFAFARALDAVVPVRLGVMSKSERGYRLLAGADDRPIKAGALSLAPGLSTAAAFQAIAHACLRQFRLNEEVLARTGDAAALHQARVALRRLRSALSLFRRVIADDRSEHLNGELRWMAATLGEARNIDVLLGRMEREPAGEALRQARERACAAAIAALGSPRGRSLMIDLAEWVSHGAWLTAHPKRSGRPVERFAADTLARYRRRLKRQGRDLADLDDERRHRVRILAKKLRYAADFFAGTFGGRKAERRRQAFLQAIEALQDGLGGLNDLATGPRVLAALGLTPAAAVEDGAPGRKTLLKQSAAAHRRLTAVEPFWR